jgi:hypothetical protein
MNKARYWNLAMMAAAAAALGAAQAGEISGRVTFEGGQPKEIKIRFDALCGKLHNTDAFTRHYVVSPEGGLANVFVYLKEAPKGETYDMPEKKPLLDQVKCFYEPYVLGVMTDQKFDIKNSDPLMHNVHALPVVEGNKEFNVGQPVRNMVYTTSFPKREVLVKLKCDIHPWMFAYIGVMDHPYFAVTDKNGKFTIPRDVPPGTYTLVANHLKCGELSQEVTIAEGEKKEVSFTMTPPAKKR